MTTTRPDGARAIGGALAAVLLAAGLGGSAPGAAHAQAQDADPVRAPGIDGRWLAWTGCWRPVTDGAPADRPTAARAVAGRALGDLPRIGERTPDRPIGDREEGGRYAEDASAVSGTLVCFEPLDVDAGVEKVTLEDGEIVARETLRADGQRHETSGEACTGWERAEFSARPGRVYVTAEHACEGGVSRSSSGILALVSTGEWVDVQVVTAGEGSDTWITRYELASPREAEAAGFALPGGDRMMAIRAARVAASARPSVDDVIEASERVDAGAVEAWLAERDAALDLDAAALVRLADAGVPEPVIDMAIAVTYPERFAVEAEPQRYGDDYAAYGYGRPWGYYGPFYGSFFYSPFGFYPYGYYSFSTFGRYGYPIFGGRFGGRFGGVRVIPVERRRDSGSRVISGQGYRRGPGAAPRGGAATPRSGGAVRTGPVRSAKPRPSASSGSSGGSSGGRTAKPRGGGGDGGGGS